MKKLVIMGGLPASGKSTMRNKLYNNLNVVDCDELKRSFKDYDEKQPQKHHAQSKVLEKALIYKYMSEGKSFVYDTTSSNLEKTLILINEAKENGYFVEMCYVYITLDKALERNAKRDRVVPSHIIYEKSEILENTMKIVKKYVDNFVVIDNN